MLNLDSNNLFEMSELTAYVNNQPFIPGRAGQLFSSTGIATTTAVLDMRDGAIGLITDTARGGNSNKQGNEGRNNIAIVTKHFPLEKTIAPSDFQNIRVFGSNNELDTLETVRNRYLDDMIKSHALTLEHQRVEAVKGLITNSASGQIDLYAEFGVPQEFVEMALGSGSTKVRNKVMDAIEMSEDAMGAELVDGYVVMCGKNFFRDFVEHANVKTAYERYQDGAALRDDVRASFVFAGAEFVSYRGKVGTTPFIADDEAFLMPKADIFRTVFAPGNFIETANTIGLPAYAKAEEADFGRGITLLTESNPISYVTRPGAVVKLHRNTAPAAV